ncbi:iron complex transport system substrate-binding protein [Arthrobacter stackebrandtii]|uniref:Iron complex transport system substrate-binding protein n=1 Tax=Arthrobacter stackebrandtii TaxID=272161 RepID=A0ABS4YUW2_9MICC|nr:ABC transporter substrate-binding protein [Arthrobacter stackebrandtii]MBP2412586.1 iron complex transport system substrate-binding protein [Arthrobacter stackebrandtii]PYH02325.1 ABC transporter substrate-binding protein [Arthrobacter stackebrandtii]
MILASSRPSAARASRPRGAQRTIAFFASVLVAAVTLSACAPPTPTAGETGTTAAASPQQGPVAACTDGTSGKLKLPADWQAADPAANPVAKGTPNHGPVTVNTDGITLPIVAPAPTPQLPTTVASCDGETVEVADVSRIVTIDLHGTLTEIVYALGLGANVVGRDRAADFKQAQGATVVTPMGHDLNAEAITALNPSVVLTDTTIGPLEVQEQLRAVGIPVIFFDPSRTMAGISHQITAVAQAMGVPAAGVELNGMVGADMAAALSAVPADSTPVRIAFLYVRGTAGVYLMAGPGSGADDIIKSVGATDVGTDIGLTMPFTQLTSEALINASPDVLLLMTGGLESVGGPEGLAKIQGIAQTPAGADRRIIDVADGTLLSFGPRSGQIVKALAEAVHGVKS